VCPECYPGWLASEAGRARREWLEAIGVSDDRRRQQLIKWALDAGCPSLTLPFSINGWREGRRAWDYAEYATRHIEGTPSAWAEFLRNATPYVIRRALTAALIRDDPLLAAASELWPASWVERVYGIDGDEPS
jgi:hypothetical protein